MSMLGMAYLNEIITHSKLAANEILDTLRRYIKIALSQTNTNFEQRDGMDLALCIFNCEQNTMQYAGAYNHLYIIRNNKLIRYKADRMPVGIHIKEVPFKNNKIELKKDDTLYIFSDGFQDQFGGGKYSKYSAKRFKDLLLDIHSKHLNQQKQLLEKTFETWKGNYSQIDDVLIIGIKIS